MRILCAHNYYGSAAPSGENRVFESEMDLLRRHGHEVFSFVRHSDQLRQRGVIGIVQAALATPGNPLSAMAIRREVERVHPNVVHVHNTFPLLSPAIFAGIGRRSARVLTLHNYRIFCPAAILMRSGRVCTQCLDLRSSWPALRYGCYRASRLATTPVALGVTLHRLLQTWRQQVDAFIALSHFQKQLLVEAGLPEDRVHVKPNFFPGHPTPVPWSERDGYAVFAGRMTVEKGVADLVQAWIRWGEAAPELRLVGDGPLCASLRELCRAKPRIPVRFLGQLSPQETQRQTARARLLILPSTCIETFGLVLVEAFAWGTPVAVSNIGPLPGLVGHGRSGVVFQPHDPECLYREVRKTWLAPGLLQELGAAARAQFDTSYNEEINHDQLMCIYETAMTMVQKRGP